MWKFYIKYTTNEYSHSFFLNAKWHTQHVQNATKTIFYNKKQTKYVPQPKPPLLYQHVVAKHDGTDPGSCFPQLIGFDPTDPKGEKAAAAEKLKTAAAAKKKKAKAAAAGGGLDDLLSAGLKTKKKK